MSTSPGEVEKCKKYTEKEGQRKTKKHVHLHWWMQREREREQMIIYLSHCTAAGTLGLVHFCSFIICRQTSVQLKWNMGRYIYMHMHCSASPRGEALCAFNWHRKPTFATAIVLHGGNKQKSPRTTTTTVTTTNRGVLCTLLLFTLSLFASLQAVWSGKWRALESHNCSPLVICRLTSEGERKQHLTEESTKLFHWIMVTKEWRARVVGKRKITWRE